MVGEGRLSGGEREEGGECDGGGVGTVRRLGEGDYDRECIERGSSKKRLHNF